MKVLITGANGFLGKHIYKKFSEESIELFKTSRDGFNNSIECDLMSKIAVENLIKKIRPELIIHCAAFVPKSTKDYNDKKSLLINSTMLKNLLNSSDSRMIYISSMTVYEGLDKIILHELDSLKPFSPYAKSKFEGEMLLKCDGRDSLIVRIPGLFGKNRKKDGLVSNVLKALISQSDFNLPDKPTLWASMSVEDASTSILKLFLNANFKGYTPINIGYEDTYSVNGFIDICEKIFRVSLKCDINHPKFKFDLRRLKKFKALPKNDFKKALIELKEFYEFENFR